MPFTAAQIAAGANYTLETYNRREPIDQVNTDKPLLALMLGALREDSIFGNGYFNEGVFSSNNSNYQNYFGADQVSHNERDPIRQAKYAWANFHDGFWFDEDRLAANGIIMVGDKTATASGAEKLQLANLLEQSFRALREGVREGLDKELHLNGTQDTKAIPGLDHIISTTPAVGVVGGIDADPATYWRNNANMGVTAANVVEEMEEMWRATMLYGGETPDKILVGSAFLDNYMSVSATKVQRHIAVQGKGGTALDPSITGVNFKGIPLVWDPTMDQLHVLYPGETYPWNKRAYGINTKKLKFRPMKGHFMVKRPPQNLPDRYVTYFGMTGKYALTTGKRSSHFVMSIA